MIDHQCPVFQFSKFTLTPLAARQEYSRTRSTPWLLMPWVSSPPCHQQLWYWLNKINCALSSIRKDSTTCSIPILSMLRYNKKNANTVQYHYNMVNFFIHKRYPIAHPQGEVLFVYCGSSLWYSVSVPSNIHAIYHYIGPSHNDTQLYIFRFTQNNPEHTKDHSKFIW